MQTIAQFAKSLIHVAYDYADTLQQRRAQSLLVMTLGLAIGVTVGTLLLAGGRVVRPLLYLGSIPLGSSRIAYILICVLCYLCFVWERRLLRRGRMVAACYVYVGLLYLVALLAYVPTELGGALIAAFTMPIVAAGVLLERRQLRIVAALVTSTLVAILVLEQLGALAWAKSGFATPAFMAIGYNVIILAVNTLMLGVFAGEQRIQLDQKTALTRDLQAAMLEATAAQRAYRLLGETGQVMIHAADDAELLNNVCLRAVEIGGYRLVWAGLAEGGTIRGVAQVAGSTDSVSIAFDPMTSQHRSAVIRTVQSGAPFTAQHLLTDARYQLWQREAAVQGYAAFAVLPLRTDDDVLGVLCFYAQEPDAFQSAEINLLEKLSGSLAFTLLSLRERRAHEQAEAERARLQQQMIEAQQQALLELSTPVIPVAEGVIVMPLIGSIDAARARDVMRALLSSISHYRAKVVILDVTGVPVIDSGVAEHLNKSIEAVRLKGAQTIITGISDAVAETIIDLGIDWTGVMTLRDLQSGLAAAMARLNASPGRTLRN